MYMYRVQCVFASAINLVGMIIKYLVCVNRVPIMHLSCVRVYTNQVWSLKSPSHLSFHIHSYHTIIHVTQSTFHTHSHHTIIRVTQPVITVTVITYTVTYCGEQVW